VDERRPRLARQAAWSAVGLFMGVVGTARLHPGGGAVMDTGGSCGSGGPDGVRRTYPDGVPGLVLAGILGGRPGRVAPVALTTAPAVLHVVVLGAALVPGTTWFTAITEG
jgi:hypothetical protein